MGRYMTELGMTPASRSRVDAEDPRMQVPEITFTHHLRGGPGRRLQEEDRDHGAAGWSRSREPGIAALRAEGACRRAPDSRRTETAAELSAAPEPAAAAEWRRVAKALQQAGVFTTFDRAALAAYCQA